MMESLPSESEQVTTPPPSSEVQRMGRALFSAAFFGTIGAFIGNWLGKRGSDPTHPHPMAVPVLKWGLGIFSALLAIYSSFKASEPQIQPSMPLPTGAVPPTVLPVHTAMPPETKPTQPGHVPLSSIHTVDSKHHGAAQTPQHAQGVV